MIVTIFGKDCDTNCLAIMRNAKKLEGNTVLVGVERFYDILRLMGISAIYYPREDNEVDHVCTRLAKMLKTQIVYSLPQRGRMTTIEVELARELGLRIVKLA